MTDAEWRRRRAPCGRVVRRRVVPAHVSQLPGLIRSRRIPVDVALVRVRPTDDPNVLSLGVMVDFVHEMVGAARVLRLNRPDQFNALSRALLQDLRAVVAGLARSKARVLILAANGRGFCAGADLKERKLLSDEEKYAHNRAINGLANELAALPIPTLVAISGIAMGGGCELSLACDLRFIAEDAVIGLTEARVGAMPGAGGSQRLPRLIGTARALEMMYSGEPIDARRAEKFGLVNAVLPADALEDHVLQRAMALSARPRRSTELLKRSVYDGMDVSLQDGLEIERIAVAEILASDDYKEGLAAKC